MSDPLAGPLPGARNPHGWRPDDPQRPCYTCGAPPSRHRYSDGSPAYTCGPHEPVTVRPPYPWPTPWEPIVVVLSDADMARAKAEGERRFRNSERRAWQTKFTPRQSSGDTKLSVHVRGAAAELAVALETGLRWNNEALPADYRKRDKRPDVGHRVEVRSLRAELRPELYSNKEDRDEWYFVLVMARPPRFTIMGWMAGTELRVQARWQQRRIMAYVARAVELRPFPLPADA